MLSDSKIIKNFERDRERAERGLSFQITQAKENQQFYAGDKMVYRVGVNDGNKRAIVNFNRIRPIINPIAGFMIQMRRKPVLEAKEIDNDLQKEFSEFANDFADYIRSSGNVDQIESSQDLDMLVNGIGATDTSIWYEKNPHGDVRVENVPIDEVLWDPMAREKNILDARYVIRRKKFPLDEALKIYKGAKPEDFQEAGDGVTGETVLVTGNKTIKELLDVDSTDSNIVNIYCYQWYELREYYRMPNPLFEIQDEELLNTLIQSMENIKEIRTDITKEEDKVEDIFTFDPRSEVLVMSSDIKNDIKTLFERFDIAFDPVEERRRIYFTSFLSGSKVFDKFKSIDQNNFTIMFKTGDYDQIQKRWLGVVDNIKEPAKFSNKALTEMLFVIASNSKGGVMYEEDAVDDPQKFEKLYASTQASIPVSSGAISGNKITSKAQAQLPNGYQDVFAIANAGIEQMAGINKEFLGSSENRQVSALLETQRIRQVSSALAPYFDAIALYQKENTKLILTYMRTLSENSEGRLIRVTNDVGATRFIPILEDKFAQEYDVDISEAPESSIQKQETANTMLSLAQQLAGLGFNIYPVALKYLNISRSDVNQLLQIMNPPAPEPDQAALAQQQEMNQIIMQAQQAQIANSFADAQYKQAGVEERQAKTIKTLAETDKTIAEVDKTIAETAEIGVDIAQSQFETFNN